MLSFLVAENFRHADNCATVECKWKRSSFGQWLDDTNSVIKFAATKEELRGHPPGTVVYLGWGWRLWVDQEILTMMRQRGYVFEEIP